MHPDHPKRSPVRAEQERLAAEMANTVRVFHITDDVVDDTVSKLLIHAKCSDYYQGLGLFETLRDQYALGLKVVAPELRPHIRAVHYNDLGEVQSIWESRG